MVKFMNEFKNTLYKVEVNVFTFIDQFFKYCFLNRTWASMFVFDYFIILNNLSLIKTCKVLIAVLFLKPVFINCDR